MNKSANVFAIYFYDYDYCSVSEWVDDANETTERSNTYQQNISINEITES